MQICKHRIKYNYIYCKKWKNYKYYVQCTVQFVRAQLEDDYVGRQLSPRI